MKTEPGNALPKTSDLTESTDEENPLQSPGSVRSELSSDRSKASEERDARNVEDDNTLDEGVADVIVEGNVDKVVQ